MNDKLTIGDTTHTHTRTHTHPTHTHTHITAITRTCMEPNTYESLVLGMSGIRR